MGAHERETRLLIVLQEMLPKKLAFVDIETTGLRPMYDRIIEIGIVRVENNTVVETFKSLINPEDYIPQEITNLTGITNTDIAAAPTFGQIKHDLISLMKDCTFVAHNVRFDYSFIRNEFKREHVPFSKKHFCTAKLSRYLFPRYRHHSLDSLMQRFGLTCENRHRAFDDAHVLWQFYEKLLGSYAEDDLAKAVASISKRPTIPLHLTTKDMKMLPEETGVYIFYGESDVPLYIGKSINLKERIRSHFSQDHASTKEMNIAQQVKRIETIVTTGELGALLYEAALVKKMQPIYNQKLRRYQRLTCLLKKTTTQGYDTICVEEIDSLTPDILPRIVGLFKTKGQLKRFLFSAAEEYNLCKKLLGLEKAKYHCFGHQLGNCNGACDNKEKPIAYNIRFAEAFANQRIKSWPFKGPIVIKENDPITKAGEGFLIQDWCYIGNFTFSQDIDTVQGLTLNSELTTQGPTLSQETIPFDYDSYKLLVAYLNEPKNHKNIFEVPQDQLFYYYGLIHSL